MNRILQVTIVTSNVTVLQFLAMMEMGALGDDITWARRRIYVYIVRHDEIMAIGQF